MVIDIAGYVSGARIFNSFHCCRLRVSLKLNLLIIYFDNFTNTHSYWLVFCYFGEMQLEKHVQRKINNIKILKQSPLFFWLFL